jgi:hypothetical protein
LPRRGKQARGVREGGGAKRSPPSASEKEKPSTRPLFIRDARPLFIRDARPLFIRDARPLFIRDARPLFIRDARPLFILIKPRFSYFTHAPNGSSTERKELNHEKFYNKKLKIIQRKNYTVKSRTTGIFMAFYKINDATFA